MFYVYILKSVKDKQLYLGYTNDLRRRVKEHNSKLNISTRSRTPFKLVYYEAYTSREDAVHREHNLKLRAKSLRQLKLRIKKSLEY